MILGSATERWGLKRLKSGVALVAERQYRRISTPELNDFLQEVDGRGAFAGLSSPKILYGAQLGVSPPALTVKVGHPERIGKNGVRYLVKRMIEKFDLGGCPIQIKFESRRK